MALDEAGNLYGTTAGCSSTDYGTIWKVSPQGNVTTLYNFAGGTSDGCYPHAGVTLDPNGNLYGVTSQCGTNNDGGFYELSADGSYTVLHNFSGSDGAYPIGEVLLGKNGTLYGTTVAGSIGGCENFNYAGCGTVWKYVP